jgi:hypothetical protein
VNATGVLLIEPVLVGVGPPVETQHNKEGGGGGGHRNIIMIVCPYMVSSPPSSSYDNVKAKGNGKHSSDTHTHRPTSLWTSRQCKKNMSGFLSIHNKLFHSFYFL